MTKDKSQAPSDKYDKIMVGAHISEPYYYYLSLLTYRDSKSKAQIIRTLIREFIKDAKEPRDLKIEIAGDLIRRWNRRKKALSGQKGWMTEDDINWQYERFIKQERRKMLNKHIPERTADVILQEVRERRYN